MTAPQKTAKSTEKKKGEQNKWRNLRNNLLLFCASIIICLLFLEIALRLLGTTTPGDIFAEPVMLQRSNNSILIYEMRPDFSIEKPGNYTLFTNMHGFRDYNHSYEKPAGTYRIVLVGDSVPFAVHVPLEKTYPKLLEKQLNDADPSPHYEVISLAIGGYSTRQEVELIKEKGLRYDPDMILVSYVLNDPITSPGPSNYFERYKPGKNGSEEQASKPCLVYTFNITMPCPIYRALHQSAIVIYLFPKVRNVYYNLQEDFYHRAHREYWDSVVSSFSQLDNLTKPQIRVTVSIMPLFKDFDAYPWKDVHAKVSKQAKKEGFTVIDLYPVLKDYPEMEIREYPEDIVHLSEKGHQIVADALTQRLLKQMNGTRVESKE